MGVRGSFGSCGDGLSGNRGRIGLSDGSDRRRRRPEADRDVSANRSGDAGLQGQGPAVSSDAGRAVGGAPEPVHTSTMLTPYGACAVTFMMVMYALERRHRAFTLAFAFGCAMSSSYGFLVGTWPFGVVEAIWALVALNRYRTHHEMQRPA